MTNREKYIEAIQSKTDEELTEMLSENLDCTKCPATNFCDSCGLEFCDDTIRAWLKQEVTE